MTRVGFIAASLMGDNWLGGINYFRSLLSALALLDEKKIQPVVFVGADATEEFINNFRSVEIVKTDLLNRPSNTRYQRIINKLFSSQRANARERRLSKLLAQHQIDVLSHSAPLAACKSVKTIGWIPDFQHVHLPGFFSEKEKAFRNSSFQKITRKSDVVLVSSETALNDLKEFSREGGDKARVLRFVPEVDLGVIERSKTELMSKYQLEQPYFHLPNQFWIHKNHKIVIQALAEIKKSHPIKVVVVSTGKTEDWRHPSYFSSLQAMIQSFGITDSFKILKVVPYSDMLGLMHHSIALINPSLFEGWSTTVEEAKAFKKNILLSDIPVHREQNPFEGVFFDPANPQDLANKMLAMIRDHTSSLPSDKEVVETHYLSSRKHFARTYERIILNLTVQI